MGPRMESFASKKLLTLLALAQLLAVASGCRAIRRFGDSHQTIAARRLSGQGFQAMHDGRWEVAESLFNDALDVSKANDRAHWGLAESHWQRGERETAIEHMEHAVRLSADDPRMVQRLGRMYLETGRLKDADAHSLWALELQRDSEEAWALRGDCLKAAGYGVEALEAYHRALAMRPDFPEVQLEAAEIYRAGGQFDRVLATLNQLQDGVGIEDAPARADMLQGIAMKHLGRTNEARRCFSRAATKSPEDAAPHLELAALALESGEVQQAQESLSTAMRLAPGTLQQSELMRQLQGSSERLAIDPNDATPELR